MSKISKFLPYLIFTFLIGLIACITFSFFIPIKQDLLSPFIFSWKLRQGILLFILYIPVIFIGTVLLGYTIIFGKFGPIKMARHDPRMTKFVRKFFIIIIIIASIYFLLSELVKPIIIEKQEINLQKTATYKEYNKLAREAYDRKNFIQALAHAKRAKFIWSESEESLRLEEAIRMVCEKCDECDEKEIKTELKIKNNNDDSFSSEYTPEQALKIAEKSMMILDFYTAHYYAKMAVKTFNERDPLKQEAEILTNKAWTEIQKGKIKYLEQPEIDYFQKKKTAYETMQAGNFLEAYYSFLEINKELRKSNSEKKDPEIENFLKLSEENLLSNVFFIDELKNIPNFTVNKNIEFIIDPIENIYMKIYGISRVIEKNKKIIYLMNIDITKKIGEKIIWAIRIPFAKIKRVNEHELILQVRAVDRQERNKELLPVALRGDSPISKVNNIKLGFGLADIDLIEEASLGSEKMKLTSLYNFISRAEDYGFRKSIYIRELIYRISSALLLMIISLFTAIIAWKFRLNPGKKFRSIWILLSPLCFGLAFIIVETAQYLYKLQIAIFVYLTPLYAPYILIGILLVTFVVLAVRLSAISSE